MKILFTDYTFSPSTNQITFNTTDTVTLINVLIITNVTTNTIIYNFTNPVLGGSITNNVLTLNYNTSGMSSSDKLQIFLDLGEKHGTETTLESINQQTQLLKKLIKILESNTVVDSAQRQRITIDAGTLPAVTTVTTVTTVSTVTSLSQIALMNPFEYNIIMSRNLYYNGIRAKLTFS